MNLENNVMGRTIYPTELLHHPDPGSLDPDLKFAITIKITSEKVGGAYKSCVNYISPYPPVPDELDLDGEENVFSLLGVFDSEYYHFVLEYALALFQKKPTLEQLQEFKILLRGRRYDFKKQWLKILFPSLTIDVPGKFSKLLNTLKFTPYFMANATDLV